MGKWYAICGVGRGILDEVVKRGRLTKEREFGKVYTKRGVKNAFNAFWGKGDLSGTKVALNCVPSLFLNYTL